MSMHDIEPTGSALHDTAAQWHVRLRAEPESAAIRDGLLSWLDADVEHRLAYAEVCAAAFACEQVLETDPRAEMQHGAPAFGGPPRPLRQLSTAASRRPRRAMIAVALAASAVFAALTPGIILGLRADFIGQPGLVQQHTLEDGSVMLLDGASAVRVRYDGEGRRVEVLRGAVHVDVRPDPARPFMVRTDKLEARALGTRYAVYRETAQHRVVVDAGRVAVRVGEDDPIELNAGQMATLPTATRRIQLDSASTFDGGWASGQLVFSATPFEEAVAAMARHLGERVVVSRSAPGDRVTAVAPVGEAGPLLERLARERGYRSMRIPGLLIVLY